MFDMSQLSELVKSPYGNALRKMIFEIAGTNYSKHEEAIEKLCELCKSPKEYQQVGNLLIAVYEAGFLRAVDQHKEALARHGLKASVIN